jgi:transposase
MPPGIRAKVGNQIIRKYTYAYTAICPETGESFSLILPYANCECMDIFMQGVSETFKDYRIIMAMDSASWHTGDKAKKWENIVPLFQPPYSPELNPVEHIWHHIRETYNFKNKTFNSMKEVEDSLVIALKELDKETVKSISRFKWIYEASC